MITIRNLSWQFKTYSFVGQGKFDCHPSSIYNLVFLDTYMATELFRINVEGAKQFRAIFRSQCNSFMPPDEAYWHYVPEAVLKNELRWASCFQNKLDWWISLIDPTWKADYDTATQLFHPRREDIIAGLIGNGKDILVEDTL